MDRRTMLTGVATLVTGGALAGCLGAKGEVPVTAADPPPGVRINPTDQPGSGGDGGGDGDFGTGSDGAVSIGSFDAIAADDGTLLVTITVENGSDGPAVRLVRATVRVGSGPGEEQRTTDRFVSLDPGASETVRLPFDVEYARWEGNGGLVPGILDRTPETPLPTDTATPSETATSTGTTASAGTTTSTGTATATETASATDTQRSPESGTASPSERETDAA